jgi:hypothetical protein
VNEQREQAVHGRHQVLPERAPGARSRDAHVLGANPEQACDPALHRVRRLTVHVEDEPVALQPARPALELDRAVVGRPAPVRALDDGGGVAKRRGHVAPGLHELDDHIPAAAELRSSGLERALDVGDRL